MLYELKELFELATLMVNTHFYEFIVCFERKRIPGYSVNNRKTSKTTKPPWISHYLVTKENSTRTDTRISVSFLHAGWRLGNRETARKYVTVTKKLIDSRICLLRSPLISRQTEETLKPILMDSLWRQLLAVIQGSHKAH